MEKGRCTQPTRVSYIYLNLLGKLERLIGMADYRLDIASLADENDINDILTASYTTLLKNDYSNDALALALPRMTKANPVLLKSGRFYVVRTMANEAAVCGGWSYERPGTSSQIGGEIEPGIAHIRHFAVHPAHLKRGAGRLLLETCLRNAPDASTFECYSTFSAEAFYASLGLEKVKPLTVDMGQGVSLPQYHDEKSCFS
ncbi:MAG: GNAT family N-acetyltransferase [Stappiaceae bacterium]